MAVAMNGFLNICKPRGITSRAVCDRVLEWFPRAKVGHVGTLDPLAEGVLVVGLNQATRLEPWLHEQPKTYTARFCLGATSTTDDEGGVVSPSGAGPRPSHEAVSAALQQFEGAFDQVPPAFSAARLGGTRAYELARKGREVVLAPRPVRIDRLTCRHYDYPWLDVVVTCGKGTYIRSLARDVGQLLGCGAYVVTLVRTAVGPFVLDQAMPWDLDAYQARNRLEPLRRAVEHLPQLVVGPDVLWRLRHGQKLPWPEAVQQPGPMAVLDEQGQLHLLALARTKDRRIVPRLVLQLGPES